MKSRVFLPPETQKWYHLDHKGPVGSVSPAGLKKQAVEHERNRLDTVAETLAMVGLLTHHGVLHGNEVITVRGALFQWVSGTVAGKTQGAHCLPGWVQFNSQPLHEMDGWTVPDLQEKGLKASPFSIKLRNFAMRVDLMTDAINVADSYIEKMSERRGLKDALRQAVEEETRLLLHRPARDAWVIHEVLPIVMEKYRVLASYACEERLDDLAEKLRLAKDADSITKLNTKALIVATYLEVLGDQSFQPESLSDTGFDGILKDVLVKP